MAKSTPHTALEGLGFKRAEESKDSSGRAGAVTTHHYTKTTNSVGDGNIVRPITHHVFVDDFDRNPGKYNVFYHVRQGGQPYAEGDFDTSLAHKDNMPRGSSDPIKDIMLHHHGVAGSLKREVTPPLDKVTPENINRLVPGPYHTTPGWDEESDPNMKGPRFILPGPGQDHHMIHLNAAQEWPLDPHVYRRLTGGRHGKPTFEYKGRFPGDDGIDVYHASYEDPESLGTYKYGFTIRHNPSLERPFSYNAEHHPNTPDENGDEPVGEFLDVTGMRDPVVNFTNVGSVIERHHNMLRHLKLMAPRPPEKPRVYTSAHEASGPVSDEDWASFVAGRNPVRGMMPDGTPVVDHFDPNFGQMGPTNPGGGNTFIHLPHAAKGSVVGEPEVYVPQGNCVTCARPTWNTAGGGEIPGDWEHTGNAHNASDHDMHGPDIPQCANCANDYNTYKIALRVGERPGGLWHRPGDKTNTCDTCYQDELGG